MNKHLTGLIAAPFTPMHPDGSLNLSLIPRYYAMLRANDVRGAFICGSTGEGVSLTIREKMAVAEAWAACSKNDPAFTVMPLLGGTCLADARELALHARDCGLDAVSFTAPFYFKPANVSVLAEICRQVAAAVPDMPFYYYHIPVLTGVGFPMIELLEKTDRNSGEWQRFMAWQKERFMERLQRYNNTDTVKTQLEERGDLTPYQKYKITTVSKFLLQALDRMKAGNYGLCAVCGGEIPVQRLLLVPGALRCMNCETKKK